MRGFLLAGLILAAAAAPAGAATLVERAQKRFQGWVASNVQPLFDQIKAAARELTGAGPAPQPDGTADAQRKSEALVSPADIKDSRAASRFNEKSAPSVANELSRKDTLPYMNVSSPKAPGPKPSEKRRLQPAKWRSIEPTPIESLRHSQ